MQKIILLFLFGILSSTSSFGQKQVTIDSLEAVFKLATQDTARIHILNSMAKEYQSTEPEKAMQYAQQALKMAENLLPLKNVEDQVESQLIESRIRKEVADALYITGQIYRDRGSYEEALKNFFKSLDNRQKLEDKKGMGFAYNAIGLTYMEQGKYEDALKMFSESLKIKISIGDKKGMANSYGNMGIIYERQGNYSESLKMHFRSLKIKQEIGYKIGIAISYTNIALIYIKQKKYEEALQMEFQALALMEETNDRIQYARTCSDIGGIYEKQENYEEALKYYFKSLKIAQELGNKYVIGGVSLNIGNLLIGKKDFAEAIKYQYKALEIMEEIGNKNGIITALIGIGNLNIKKGKPELSLSYFNKAILLSKTIGDKSLIKECYSGFTEAYSKMQEYKKSFEYQQLYIEISDSILNEESLKQINEMKTKYETEKKEKEIELLNKDKKLKEIQFEAELKEQTTLRNVFIGGFILVLLLAFVSFIGYRQKIRSNAIIASKNEEISKQKANITGQEEERKRIAQELHDGIGGTLAGIKLNLIRISSSPDNILELESVITNIGDACKEIRTISHNLAPPALSNTSFIETMKDVIQKFVVPGKMDIRFDYFPEKELNQIPANIHADLYRITQELLHNIVKHAKASTVEIDLSKEGDYLYLLVEDNGIGFDIGSVKKGIGLKNIESRVNLLNGKMIVDSKIGRGTATNIHIPITGKLTNTTFT